MISASRKSKDKYLQEKVDTFVLRVPKGEKEKIKQYAASKGKSLNSYIIDLISSDMPSFVKSTVKQSAPKQSTPTPVKRNSLPDFLD